MTRLEKAIANLEDRGITAKVEFDSVYVFIDWTELEISETEIDFQADEWESKNTIT